MFGLLIVILLVGCLFRSIFRPWYLPYYHRPWFGMGRMYHRPPMMGPGPRGMGGRPMGRGPGF